MSWPNRTGRCAANTWQAAIAIISAPASIRTRRGPATHDHCTALMAFRIDEGRSGATRLDGLKFAFVIRSGKVMADGNWVFGVIVDETAGPDQRRALGAIASG